MDQEGFGAINKALTEHNVVATVIPEPALGENVEYLTISTGPEVAPAEVLNALGKAAIIPKKTVTSRGYPRGPQLELMFGQQGSITFIDTNMAAS